MSIQWSGNDTVLRNMMLYAGRVHQAVVAVAQYWSSVLETEAKQNAPWQDQTANARQSLYAFVRDVSRDTVELYLAHGVEYGIYLEVKYAGKYAIIWPTLEAHLNDIRAMLEGIFR